MDKSTPSKRNKTILKNTMYMYLRMLVMLGVSLFTARIVFNTLGVNDYGTYNVVGGIIVFFSFINNGLNAATKRYITSEIACGTEKSTAHVFNVCIQSHIFISLIVLLLAETIGLWGVNNILNIPEDRIDAANFVYQFSVFAAVIGIMQSPFNAAIVAYERMNIYAYFSIIDVVLKLLVIFLVQIIAGDKLIVYAILIFGTSLLSISINVGYAFRSFYICRLHNFRGDKPLLKSIFNYTSWSLAGQAAVVGTNQGVNVLINVFFNVAVNAAMGVSNMITGTVNNFISNFQIAFNPQIIKSYSSKEYDYLQSLIIRASKMSSFLIIIFLVPLFYETGNVLSIWLGDYPQYAVEFCIFTLITIYIEALSAPLWMVIYAQTDIRQYQIVISSVYSLNFFGGWIVLLWGAAPYSVILVRIIIYTFLAIIRLFFAKKIFPQLNIKKWLYEVVVKGFVIISIATTITGGLVRHIETSTFAHIVITTIISLCITIPAFFLFGMTVHERSFVKDAIVKKLHI